MSRPTTVPVHVALMGSVMALGMVLLSGPLLGGYGLLGLAALQVLALAVPALLVARMAPGPATEVLGLGKPTRRIVAGALLIGSSFWLINAIFVVPLSLELFGAQPELFEQAKVYEQTSLWALLLVQAGFPALCEELMFRGLLARSLQARWGLGIAVVASSLAFALVHWPVSRMLPALATGLALGYVALSSRSTVAAMIVHLVNNSIALTLAKLASPGDERSSGVLPDAPTAIALAIALAVSATGFHLVSRRRRE